MGREAEVVFKKFAGMISTKTDKRYSVVIGWLRTRVSFSLLRSALTCLRDSPAKRVKPTEDIAIANAEAAMKQWTPTDDKFLHNYSNNAYGL